jgi:glycosyltransferase involved in cell wall biosynthesis
MPNLQGHRVAIVTNIPIHYRVALFERLDQLLAEEGALFQVLFLSGIPADRRWIEPSALSFSHEFVDSYDLGRKPGRRLVPRSLHRVLDDFEPTIVLSAGFSPFVSGRAANWCSGRGAFGIWSGEIASRPTARNRLRRASRRKLVAQADFAIAYGWESVKYLRSLRKDLPVVIGRNSTVVPRATRRISAGPVELLTVSRAERGKALELLVDAMKSLQDIECCLTVVGDGKEFSALKSRAKETPQIQFVGALPHRRVLEEYRRAEVFLFPSQYDIFGLVMVEAMAAGLAVISSDKPGAVSDIAASGVNCLLVRDPSPEAWAAAIRLLVNDAAFRRHLGEWASRTIHHRWTINHAAAAMMAGLTIGALAPRMRRSTT